MYTRASMSESTTKFHRPKRLTCLAVLIAASFCGASMATDQMHKAQYDTAIERANADFKAAHAKCETLHGDAEDICEKDAKAMKVAAEGRAKALRDGTPGAVAEAREDTAEARYDAAKERCKQLSGNDKDVCIKAAKLQETKAVEDAKADEKDEKTEMKREENVAEARYKLELEKCDSLAGDSKDACQAQAKAAYKP